MRKTGRMRRAVVSWLLVCAMMVGLMPMMGVYAEDQNADNSQGYGIESVQVEDTSADVILSTKSDALLFVAVYDENGRQKMIVSQSISSNQTEATLEFEKAVSAEDTVKVFMVDPKTQAPLCEDFIWEHGVIYDSWEHGVIYDSWEQIIASINDGTYRDRYHVGDTKELDLGSEGIVDMQIAAFDADELVDGTGTAAITWISKYAINNSHRMNPSREYNADSDSYVIGTGSVGGWEYSEIRTWLKNVIKPLIPSTVRNSIKSVKKYSSSYDTSLNYERNAVTIDDVWIPSNREMFGNVETAGPTYNELSRVNADYTGEESDEIFSVTKTWWLRSAPDKYYDDGSGNGVYGGSYSFFICIQTYFDIMDHSIYLIDGTIGSCKEASVKFGFCLGATKQVVDLSSANVGDYVTFGHYEQDNDATNGKEPIEWKVLDKENGRALLLSKYGLDCKPYNENRTDDVTWEACTLRK